MSNFAINFSHPWLLFLLIPAVVIIVVAIMRVPKKYRNTRNRVVSVVLESVVALCAVLLLAGMTFTYTTGNTQNEVMLLVDVTDTMDACADQRDDYVRSLVYNAEDNDCKLGIVTFGFTQVYAAPLSTDYDKIYDQYKNAQLPDTTATDLASALEYSAKLFTNPEASKIVVISDGKETDQSAVNTLTALASQGTTVETVYIPSAYEGNDIQIVNVETPEYHVNPGDTIDITLDIHSNYEGSVSLVVTDNGEQMPLYDSNGDDDTGEVSLKTGTNAVTFRCTLYEKYLHAIRITLTDVDEEVLTQNNSYCVYIYIDSYNRVLIFERAEGESAELEEVLQGKDGGVEELGEEPYVIDIITLPIDPTDVSYAVPETMPETMPTTVDDLRQYDLVILNNTSNDDMYRGYLNYLDDRDELGDFWSYFYTTSGKEKSGGGLLPQLLYTYVYNYGGGLLTVGGVAENEDGELVANMYKRSDMYGTVLQQMLPVTAINYTPPTGVVVVIDTSGSMGSGEGSLLQYAILGVMNSLNLLSVRDYMGIIEFSSNPHIVLSLTSLVYASDIRYALNDLLENPQSAGTVLYSSFQAAITMLDDDSDLYERKHIIFVTDGLLSDTSDCYGLAESCKTKGITVTSIVVGGGSTGLENMRSICERADGADNVVTDKSFLYDCSTSGTQSQVGDRIYDDIQAMVWEEINYTNELIGVSSSYMFSTLLEGLFYVENAGTEDEVTYRNYLDAYISRFYGTTIKTGASLILNGDFSVPIYAQWSFGEGMVGSYMGDLHDFGAAYDPDTGQYSDNSMILESPSGKQFIINVVDNLMPTEDIRPNGMTVNLTEDNYTNRVSVYADMEDGYTVDAKIYACEGELAGSDWYLDLNKATEGDTDYMDAYVTVAMTDSNNYARADFVIKTPGVYRIEITLYDADGNVVRSEMGVESSVTLYKKLSYSAEYNNFNAEDGLTLMDALSTGEYGAAITEADDLVLVFEGLVTRLTKSVDPRLALAIIALVLFLLGIAVRKFKWKWPHEIARERKAKKEMQGKALK